MDVEPRPEAKANVPKLVSLYQLKSDHMVKSYSSASPQHMSERDASAKHRSRAELRSQASGESHAGVPANALRAIERANHSDSSRHAQDLAASSDRQSAMSRLVNEWVKRVAWATVFRCAEKILSGDQAPASDEIAALMHNAPDLLNKLSSTGSSFDERRDALKTLLPLIERVAPAASQPIMRFIQGGLTVLDHAMEARGRLARAPVGSARLLQVLTELEMMIEQPTIATYLGPDTTHLRWAMITARQWLSAMDDVQRVEEGESFATYFSTLWGTDALQSIVHGMLPWLDLAQAIYSAMPGWGTWATSMIEAYGREETPWGKLKWLVELLSDERARQQVETWMSDSIAPSIYVGLDQLPVLLDLMRRFESFPLEAGWAMQGKWALDVTRTLPGLSSLSDSMSHLLGTDDATWGAIVNTLVTISDPAATWSEVAYVGLQGIIATQPPAAMLGVLAKLVPLAGYTPYVQAISDWGPRVWAISREFYREVGQTQSWAEAGRCLLALMRKHLTDKPYVTDVLGVLDDVEHGSWRDALRKVSQFATEASTDLRTIYDLYLKIGIAWKVAQAVRQAHGAEARARLREVTDVLHEVNAIYGHPYFSKLIEVIPLLPALQEVRQQIGDMNGGSWFEWADNLIDVLASHPNETLVALRQELGQQIERSLVDTLFGFVDQFAQQPLLPGAEARPTAISQSSSHASVSEMTLTEFMDMESTSDESSDVSSLSLSGPELSAALPVLDLETFKVVEGVGEDDAPAEPAANASWNLATVAWSGGASVAAMSAIYASYRLYLAHQSGESVEDLPLEPPIDGTASPIVRDNRREQLGQGRLPWLMLLSASLIGAVGMGTMAYRSMSVDHSDATPGGADTADTQAASEGKSRPKREAAEVQIRYPRVGASLRMAFDRPLSEMLRLTQMSEDQPNAVPKWSAASPIPVVGQPPSSQPPSSQPPSSQPPSSQPPDSSSPKQPKRLSYSLADIALGFHEEELLPQNLRPVIEWPAEFPSALRQRVARSSPVIYQQLVEWGRGRSLHQGDARTFAIKLVHSLLIKRLNLIASHHPEWRDAAQRVIVGLAKPAQIRVHSAIKATEFAIPLDESSVKWLVIDVRNGVPFVIERQAESGTENTTSTPRTLVEQSTLGGEEDEQSETMRVAPLKLLAVTMVPILLQTTRYNWNAQFDAISQYLGEGKPRHEIESGNVEISEELKNSVDYEERTKFLTNQMWKAVGAKNGNKKTAKGLNAKETREIYAGWLRNLAVGAGDDPTPEAANRYLAVLARYGAQVQFKDDLARSIESLRRRRQQGKIQARSLPMGQARVEAMRQYLAAANLSTNLIDDITILALANRVLDPEDVFYDEAEAGRLTQLTAINYYVSLKALNLDRVNDESTEAEITQSIIDELYVAHKDGIFNVSTPLDSWKRAFDERYGDLERKSVWPDFKSRNEFDDRNLTEYYKQFTEYKNNNLEKDVALYVQTQASVSGVNQLDMEGVIDKYIRAEISFEVVVRGVQNPKARPGNVTRYAPHPIYIIQAKSGHIYAASVLGGLLTVTQVDNLLRHPRRLMSGELKLEDEVSLEDLAALLWPADTATGTPLEQLKSERGSELESEFVEGSMRLSQRDLKNGNERLESFLMRLQRTVFESYIDTFSVNQLDKTPFETFLSLVPFKDVITRLYHDSEYVPTIGDLALDVLDLSLTIISIGIPLAKLSGGAIKALKAAFRAAKLKNLQGKALRLALIDALRPFINDASKVVALETSSFLVPGIGPLQALIGGASSLRRAVEYGANEGITVPPKMKEMPLFGWAKARPSPSDLLERYRNARTSYMTSAKNAEIAEGSNAGTRPFDVGYDDYERISIEGIDETTSSTVLMERFVDTNAQLNLMQRGALSRRIELAQVRENLDRVRAATSKLGPVVQKGAHRVLLAPQYNLLAEMGATKSGRCLPLAKVMAYALSQGKSGALINFLSDPLRHTDAFPAPDKVLGFLHGSMSATLPSGGKKDVAEIVDGLDELNISTYWILETPNHAMMVGKTVRSGTQIFHFYEPNLGLMDYLDASDFKQAMQKTIGTRDMRKTYQVGADGKFEVKSVNLDQVGASRVANGQSAKSVQQWIDSMSSRDEFRAAEGASRVPAIQAMAKSLQLSTASRTLNQYKIVSKGGTRGKAVAEVPVGDQFKIYTALDDVPADDLDVNVHGGYIDDQTVEVPPNTTIEVMEPHGTTLQDMGVAEVLTKKYTPYATVESKEIKFWGVGRESVQDPNGGNARRLYSLRDQVDAPSTPEAKRMAAAGTEKKGHIRDYLMGRFQDTSSAAGEAPETVSDIADAVRANRIQSTSVARRDVVVATTHARVDRQRMPRGLDAYGQLAWLESEFRRVALALPRMSDLFKQLEYMGLHYKRIRFVGCRENAMTLEVSPAGKLVRRAEPPHIVPELRSRDDIDPDVLH
ncbi:hypothetical protein U0E23_33080 [Burkholderia stagnalis]|nr:hypothetical protein [Burkholderia stagnalis]MDY7807270.1 hypothetical protein [Burkholderia stagnalis]